jgi:predicted Zn-dependent protease
MMNCKSDDLGVKMMIDAGYDPYAMVGVMEILAKRWRSQQNLNFNPHQIQRIVFRKSKETIEKYQ